MFKKILVPLDGSQLSQCVLEPTLPLSRPDSAERLRVPVVDRLSFAVTEAGQRELAQDTLISLETLCKTNEQSRHNIHPQLLDGEAAFEKADRIAMSAHGYSGLTRWALGSLTAPVLRSVSCSLLVIRPTPS